METKGGMGSEVGRQKTSLTQSPGINLVFTHEKFGPVCQIKDEVRKKNRHSRKLSGRIQHLKTWLNEKR